MVESFFLKNSRSNIPNPDEKTEGMMKADTFTVSSGKKNKVKRGVSKRTPVKIHISPKKEKIAEYFFFITLSNLDVSTGLFFSRQQFQYFFMLIGYSDYNQPIGFFKNSKTPWNNWHIFPDNASQYCSFGEIYIL